MEHHGHRRPTVRIRERGRDRDETRSRPQANGGRLMPATTTKTKARKTANGGGIRARRKLYAVRAYEFDNMVGKLGYTQDEVGELLEFAGRTSRRYKRGEGKVPLSTLILMKFLVKGVVDEKAVRRAAASFRI